MIKVEPNPKSGSQCRSTRKTELNESNEKEQYTSQKQFDFLKVPLICIEIGIIPTRKLHLSNVSYIQTHI